nr:MAG TPA: hypothetical protein [Caudoviricetes sp.]
MKDEIVLSNDLNTEPLDSRTQKIAQEILDTEDIDKVKDLTSLFNLNTKKRNVMRVLKMTQLLDNVTDKVIERFEKTPDNFSNEDLLKYMQVTENAIDKANKNLDMVEETPAIQFQQNNQVNINIDRGLDRDSRAKVTEAVEAILKKLQNNEQVIEVENIEEIKDEPIE